jgi:hypothetical protein
MHLFCGSKKKITPETLLLIQVDNGEIVERTGNGVVTTSGTVIIDPITTYDGYGSIRNTTAGSTIATGYVDIGCNLTITGDFTVEAWLSPLAAGSTYREWIMSDITDPLHPLIQIINEDLGTSPWFRAKTIYSGGGWCTAYLKSEWSNEFRHFAAVRQGTEFKLYVAGVDTGFVVPGDVSGTRYVTNLRLGSLTGPCCLENIRVSNIARYTSNFIPRKRF